MPRRSVEAMLSVVDARHQRIKPPAGLPGPVRAIWSRLVDALPGDRFHSSDGPLLALYCRSLHQAAIAFDELEALGASREGAISPWLRVSDVAVKQAATLASKLRLTPQARLDRKVAGPAARNEHDGPKIWERLSDDDDSAKDALVTDDELEDAIRNWSSWCRSRRGWGQAASMEGGYRSPQHWDVLPVTKLPATDAVAAQRLELAVCSIDLWAHSLLRYWFIEKFRPDFDAALRGGKKVADARVEPARNH